MTTHMKLYGLTDRVLALASIYPELTVGRIVLQEKGLYHIATSKGEKLAEIIADGSGQAFEPLLVEVFLDIREKIEHEHHLINRGNNHE